MSTFRSIIAFAGLTVFCVAVFGMLSMEATMVLVFIAFVPGPLLGLLISFFTKSGILRKVIFVIVFSLIYFGGIYLVDFGAMGSQIWPFRIMGASILSCVLFQLTFDLIFDRKSSLSSTIVGPAVVGFIASLITTISILCIGRAAFDIPEVILWLGIFSIFPVFYIFYSAYLERVKKVCN